MVGASPVRQLRLYNCACRLTAAVVPRSTSCGECHHQAQLPRQRGGSAPTSHAGTTIRSNLQDTSTTSWVASDGYLLTDRCWIEYDDLCHCSLGFPRDLITTLLSRHKPDRWVYIGLGAGFESFDPKPRSLPVAEDFRDQDPADTRTSCAVSILDLPIPSSGRHLELHNKVEIRCVWILDSRVACMECLAFIVFLYAASTPAMTA